MHVNYYLHSLCSQTDQTALLIHVIGCGYELVFQTWNLFVFVEELFCVNRAQQINVLGDVHICTILHVLTMRTASCVNNSQVASKQSTSTCKLSKFRKNVRL